MEYLENSLKRAERMNLVEGRSFTELKENACAACKSGTVDNLVIHGVLDYKEVDSEFIRNIIKKSEMWQAEVCSNDLVFNHGYYIHKAGDGIEFLINELTVKPTSDRACYSLVDMEDIVTSGDGELPSLLVYQVGLSKSKKTLFISSYFRAIEVKKFLPINFGEAAYIAKKLQEKFYDIDKIELNFYIFRARYIDNFYCYEKCKIDKIKEAEITAKVFCKDYKEIINLLYEKKSVEETIVEVSGMKSLQNAISVAESLVRKKTLSFACDDVIEQLNYIIELRKQTSEEKELYEANEKLKTVIEALIDEFQMEINGNE